MISEKKKRIIQLALILTGTILGGLFLSDFLNGSTKASGLLGGFVGFLVGLAIFPETGLGLFEEQSELRQSRLKKERTLGFWRSFTHPTQVPLTLSLILFVLILVLAALLDYLKIKGGSEIFQIGFLIMMFLWGLSGFLIISRKEYVDNNGRRYRNWWAVFYGIPFLIMGWGGFIFLLLAQIFEW
jgi:hypothetical protein